MIDEKTVEKFRKKLQILNKDLVTIGNEAINIGKKGLKIFNLENKIDPNILRKAKQKVAIINF